MKHTVVSLAVIGLVIAALKWLPASFIWIYTGLALFFFLLYRRNTLSARVIWFNAGGIFLVLLLFELTLEGREYWLRRDHPSGVGHQVYVSKPHPVLGYVLLPGSARRLWKSYGGRNDHDVTYTINDQGFRIAPPATRASDRSVLFFGCSFTYGEGVEDDETMPYRVGDRLDGRYAVHNFAVHGYGPQHMLALIETGVVAETVVAKPEVAVYQALYPEHVHRVAGLRNWVRTGPRYVIGADGRAVHSGRFVDHDYSIPAFPLWRLVEKSALGRFAAGYTRPTGPDEDALFVAVLVRSAELLRERYPGLAFHLLMWGHPPPAVIDGLESAGVELHYAEAILEAAGIPDNAVYIDHDGHPTAQAHAALGEYLLGVRSGFLH
ncbi:MAG TPA: hypothetical protein VI566_00215 [Xanthomonadales bacterium]|nr:hypothetical protein [Xanthomonadales bacterium]